MMIFAGACTVVAAFTVPETYAPVLLQKKVRIMQQVGVSHLSRELAGTTPQESGSCQERRSLRRA